MEEENNKLLFLTDVIETKLRKEKELEFYQKQLEKLQQRMFFIKKDIDLTNTIIDIIENEKVLDIKEQIANSKKYLIEPKE